MQHPTQTNLTTLSSSALLFEVNFSIWTGRKQDKNATREVTNNKKAAKDAASVTKYLMAGTDKLASVVALSQQIRQWVYKRTLPWSDAGVRLLPASEFQEFAEQLSEWESAYDSKVKEFLTEYPTLVSAAAFKLGDMFNRDEYPTVSEIQDKFGIHYSFSPLPTSGDFRVDMSNETVAELRNKYDTYLETKLNSAMRDAWDRLYETLGHLSAKLNTDYQANDQGKVRRTPLHASTLDNAVELCSMLTTLNIANDPELEARRKELENALFGIDAKEIQKRDGAREELKSRVDEILGKFGEGFAI